MKYQHCNYFNCLNIFVSREQKEIIISLRTALANAARSVVSLYYLRASTLVPRSKRTGSKMCPHVQLQQDPLVLPCRAVSSQAGARLYRFTGLFPAGCKASPLSWHFTRFLLVYSSAQLKSCLEPLLRLFLLHVSHV